MEILSRNFPKNSFILAFERNTARMCQKYKAFNVITAMCVENHMLILLNKTGSSNEYITYLPIDYDKKFSWVPRVRLQIERTRKLVLVSETQPCSGILGEILFKK